MCCNPANGKGDFEEWSAYKIQLHGIESIVSLSSTETKVQKKKKKKKKKKERKKGRKKERKLSVLHSFIV